MSKCTQLYIKCCTSVDTLKKASTYFDTCIYREPSHKISIYKPSPSLYPVSSGFPSIEHAHPRFANVKTSNDITSSCLEGNIREFRIHQRDGDKNAKKENRFNKQNNNLAHVSHFFVQFFAIFAQLCPGSAKFCIL